MLASCGERDRGARTAIESFVGATVETGNVWNRTQEIKPSSLIWAGSLYGAAETIVGPVYLGWGFAEEGRNTFYFSLGLPL